MISRITESESACTEYIHIVRGTCTRYTMYYVYVQNVYKHKSPVHAKRDARSPVCYYIYILIWVYYSFCRLGPSRLRMHRCRFLCLGLGCEHYTYAGAVWEEVPGALWYSIPVCCWRQRCGYKKKRTDMAFTRSSSP